MQPNEVFCSAGLLQQVGGPLAAAVLLVPPSAVLLPASAASSVLPIALHAFLPPAVLLPAAAAASVLPVALHAFLPPVVLLPAVADASVLQLVPFPVAGAFAPQALPGIPCVGALPAGLQPVVPAAADVAVLLLVVLSPLALPPADVVVLLRLPALVLQPLAAVAAALVLPVVVASAPLFVVLPPEAGGSGPFGVLLSVPCVLVLLLVLLPLADVVVQLSVVPALAGIFVPSAVVVLPFLHAFVGCGVLQVAQPAAAADVALHPLLPAAADVLVPAADVAVVPTLPGVAAAADLHFLLPAVAACQFLPFAL